MLNILDTLEDRPAKQRLRELQVAKGEREEAEAPEIEEHNRKVRQEQDRLIDQKQKWDAIAPHLEAVHQAYNNAQAAQAKGETYAMSDDEITSLIEVHKQSHSLPKDQADFQDYTKAHRDLTDFYMKHQDIIGKANGVIERGKYGPEIDKAMDNMQKVFPHIQTDFTDKYGKGDKDGSKATVNKIFIRDGKITLGLHIESPVGDDIFPHISDGTVYSYPKDETINQKEIGNINLNDPGRKIHGNANGSMSSIRTIQITEDDGTVVLLPTVGADGKYMTTEEAVKHYQKTNEHLGKFENRNDADAYDELLHRDLNTGIGKADLDTYAKNITDKGEGKKVREYDTVVTHGRNADGNSPIAQIPLNYMTASHEQHGKVIDMVLRAEAQNPKYWDEIRAERKGKEKQTEEGRQALEALTKIEADPKFKKMSPTEKKLAVVKELLANGTSLEKAEKAAALVTTTKATPKNTREIKKDGRIITQEFDEDSQAWKQIATTSQFRPKEKKTEKEKDRSNLYVHEQDNVEKLAAKDAELAVDDEEKDKVVTRAMELQEKAYKDKNEVMSASDALKKAKKEAKDGKKQKLDKLTPESAAANKGRTVKNEETGDRYTSDGKTWVKQ
jgi:hypothetical protein